MVPGFGTGTCAFQRPSERTLCPDGTPSQPRAVPREQGALRSLQHPHKERALNLPRLDLTAGAPPGTALAMGAHGPEDDERAATARPAAAAAPAGQPAAPAGAEGAAAPVGGGGQEGRGSGARSPEPPAEFVDPISEEIMVDPVLLLGRFSALFIAGCPRCTLVWLGVRRAWVGWHAVGHPHTTPHHTVPPPAETGQTYERASIQQWFATCPAGRCLDPLTGTVLKSTEVSCRGVMAVGLRCGVCGAVLLIRLSCSWAKRRFLYLALPLLLCIGTHAVCDTHALPCAPSPVHPCAAGP